MFAPIDPPNQGYPQQTAYVDGLHGGYSFQYPGVGQIAQGVPHWDPRGQLLHLLSQGSPQMITPPRPKIGLPDLIPGSPMLQGDVIPHQLPMHGHFTMVHAAQNLAKFLASQTHAGLRRYGARQ